MIVFFPSILICAFNSFCLSVLYDFFYWIIDLFLFTYQLPLNFYLCILNIKSQIGQSLCTFSVIRGPYTAWTLYTVQSDLAMVVASPCSLLHWTIITRYIFRVWLHFVSELYKLLEKQIQTRFMIAKLNNNIPQRICAKQKARMGLMATLIQTMWSLAVAVQT